MPSLTMAHLLAVPVAGVGQDDLRNVRDPDGLQLVAGLKPVLVEFSPEGPLLHTPGRARSDS
jgi:hypothetical protein